MSSRILVLLALALLPIATASCGQDDADPAAEATSIPCPDGILTDFSEVEGETIECGTVTVPIDYDEPDGPTMDLVYAILRSRSAAPAPDPVISLHGGPGMSELAVLTEGYTARFETLRQRRDLVFFDQRGGGYSFGPIDCKALFDEEFEAALAEAEEALGPDAPLYAPRMTASQAINGDCAEALMAEGVDLSQFNTVNNARDVARLADALGLDSYNLLGTSYGTRLGLEVLRQQPEGLRSLLIDSVVPHDIPFNDRMPEANIEAFQSIQAMCLLDEACAAAYPDLEERLNRVFARLDKEPLTTERGFPVTSEDLEVLLTITINTPLTVGMVPYLPRMIHELDEGVTETYEGLTSMSLLISDEAEDRYVASAADDAEGRRLLDEANDLARQSAELDAEASSLALQALAAIRASAPGDRFWIAVDERWESSHSAAEARDFRTDYLSLPTRAPTAATLEAFVDRHFRGADAQELSAVIAGLSEEEIARMFEDAHFNRRFHDLANEMAHHLYSCNDGVPFNSLEGLLAYAETSPIPGLTRGEVEKQALFLEGCERLPTGTLPDSFHEPVTGDGTVPVMVFGATNDTQTAVSWARKAADDVVGARYVEFPNSGHGAMAYSRCAQDVAAAFLDDPDVEIDSSCTADLVPRFVLPDEPLGEDA